MCRIDMFVRDEEKLLQIEVVCKCCLSKALRIDKQSCVSVIYVPKRGSKDRASEQAVCQGLIKRVRAAKHNSADPIFRPAHEESYICFNEIQTRVVCRIAFGDRSARKLQRHPSNKLRPTRLAPLPTASCRHLPKGCRGNFVLWKMRTGSDLVANCSLPKR